MKRNLLTRLACFSMALAVIFGGTALYYGKKTAVYGDYISFQNQRALSSLLSDVDALDCALQKTACVQSGEMRSLLAAEIWRRCEGARSALSVLPLNEAHLEKTEKYLAQAGDYAYYLLRQDLYGGVTDGDGENLTTLSKIASSLVPQLTALKERCDTGDAVFEAAIRGQGTAMVVTDVLSQTETNFPEFEGLTYDGPFSEHISQQTAKALEGQTEYPAEQARAAVSKLLEMDGLELQYASDGVVPYYCFSDGGSRTVCVAKAGGKLVSLTDERAGGESALSPAEAVEAGTKWLASHGYDNMTSTYYTLSGGTANINYVYTLDGAAVYPDLITLSIALDDGSVVRMDASGYLMNHTERQAPVSDKSQNYTPASEGMTVLSQRLAVIPTAGKNEVWCREYLCSYADGKALVYVNCENGKTENILLVVEGENGTLTR